MRPPAPQIHIHMQVYEATCASSLPVALNELSQAPPPTADGWPLMQEYQPAHVYEAFSD
jgi:hypothetical protein